MNEKVNENSILFSTGLIPPVLTGRKTQTRRIIKPPPNFTSADDGDLIRSRYGRAGDRLWIKETFYAYGRFEYTGKLTGSGRREMKFRDLTLETGLNYIYHAERTMPVNKDKFSLGWHKRPSVFMPRRASRILLEIVGISVERVQSISAADALAEGVAETDLWNPKEVDENPKEIGQWKAPFWDDHYFWNNYPQIVFEKLWKRINGPESWDQNPWVQAIDFRMVC